MNYKHQNIFTDCWQSLVRATNDRKHPYRYLCLATWHETFGVSQRTVVLRKAIPTTYQLVFYTDFRTKKIEEIRSNPLGSVLGYHPRHRTQLRLQGSFSFERQTATAQKIWQQLPDAQRRDYCGFYQPGTPLSTEENTFYTDVEEGYPNFCLLFFQVKALDYLQLDKERHQRIFFCQEENTTKWASSILQP